MGSNLDEDMKKNFRAKIGNGLNYDYSCGLMFTIAKLRLQLYWSHLNFICIREVQINFTSCLIPVTGNDELDELVCCQHMGLRSSVGRALQR